jgi:hypothetical protein
VRAPWGALSGQDSGFLPISRMITSRSDAARLVPYVFWTATAM